ncbi:MAG TPA: glycogen/starch synthase [Steroidobacteraceae bacterium]|nr:glycogen/starch synthase [Steroidobacteraceae bacterium]
MARHRICFLAAEVSPLAKTGGLGDVAGALVRQLHRRGHDVRLFVPLHGVMQLQGIERRPHERLRDVPVAVGTREYRYDVHEARLPGRDDLWVHLVDCPELFDRPHVYSDAADEHLRFLMLTRAALECCQRLGFAPEIVHCNDWHTAFAPLLLRTAYAWDRQVFGRTRSVFTIHNIGYQGTFDATAAADVGPGVGREALHAGDLAQGRINPMRHAILHADAVTTVSPTYAREIRTPEGGHGLDADLRARRDAVCGILNGVDYEDWNPATDRLLPFAYDAGELAGKARNKEALLDLLRMPAPATTPLIGMVTRLTRQKGIDLLEQTLPELLQQRDVRFVALGSGEPKYERFMASLQERFPGKAVFYSGYSEELAHFIEAASDIFLMPSLYEPCGLNQMYSLRYGTVPIVRRTGGLADSVQHFDPATGQGTGVVFNDFDAGGLRWGLATALEWYGWPSVWRRLVQNGMAQDFSWEASAAEYEKLYERLAGRV